MHFRQKYFVIREPIPTKIYFSLSLGTIALIIAIYILITKKRLISPLFLPPLSQVIGSIVEMHSEKIFFPSIYASVWRVYFGLLLAVIVALPLGILMGSYKFAEGIISPIVAFVRYLPTLGLIPLFIIWFGIGDVEKLVIIFFGAFFQLVTLTSDDVANVRRELLEISYTLGITPKKAFRKVIIPAALPSIVDDIRMIAGWAWTYVVVSELVAANKGLGYIIIQSMRAMKTERIVMCILIIGGLGLLTDRVFALVHKQLFPWTEKAGK